MRWNYDEGTDHGTKTRELRVKGPITGFSAPTPGHFRLLEGVAAECGPGAVWFEADVRDIGALEQAVDGTVERLGGIDVAVANAGIVAAMPVAHSDLAAMESSWEIFEQRATITLSFG